MQIRRIEIDGSHGHLAIERDRRALEKGTTIRIDSIIRDPNQGEKTWKTWEVESRIDADALFKIAQEVQQRTDGQRGTNSMVHDYFNELQRFVD